MQAGNLSGKREPDSGAAIASGRPAVGLAKAFEYEPLRFRRNPDPAVDDVEHHHRRCGSEADLDPAAGVGELERVGELVDDDAFELLAVDPEVVGDVFDDEGDRELFARGEGLGMLDVLTDEVGEVVLLNAEPEEPLLDAREIEEGLDEPKELDRVAQHQL